MWYLYFASVGLEFKWSSFKKAKKMRIAKKRSLCPVACTLDIIGDKWTLLVIRDLLLGRSRFREFAASPEKIATNILSDRLTRLSEHGLVERYPSPDTPGRNAYRLTKKGKSLGEIVKSMVEWGTKNIDGTEARLKPK